ncbi:MAG: hypothetical protein ACKPJO_12020 [Dolichospermum sp.]
MRPSARLVVLGKKLWTPVQMSTALWLDAADSSTIILNGSTVSQWRDKSGNGRHISQGTAANQPARTLNGLNGKPVLTFDGSDFFNPVTASLSQFSVIMVEIAAQNTQDVYYPVGFTSGETGLSVGGTFLSQRFSLFNGTTAIATSETSVLNTPTIVFAGSNSSGRQISVNGNAPATDSTSQSITQITVGRRGDGQWPFFGTIPELIFTDNLLSTTERQLIEGYLAWKWGLTANLLNNHPFKFNPPLA